MVHARFLTIQEIILLHDILLGSFGGAAGIRDKGLLDSAINQPNISFDGKQLHPDIASMAAAYCFHIIQNHPFVDGNKRTGTGAAVIFVGLNQHTLALSDKELYQLAISVATSQITKEELTAVLAKHLIPL